MTAAPKLEWDEEETTKVPTVPALDWDEDEETTKVSELYDELRKKRDTMNEGLAAVTRQSREIRAAMKVSPRKVRRKLTPVAFPAAPDLEPLVE